MSEEIDNNLLIRYGNCIKLTLPVQVVQSKVREIYEKQSINRAARLYQNFIRANRNSLNIKIG